MSNKVDIVQKFWDSYYNADMIKREKVLKPVLKAMLQICDIPKTAKSGKKTLKLREHTMKLALMGYFDDLIEYMEAKRE